MQLARKTPHKLEKNGGLPEKNADNELVDVRDRGALESKLISWSSYE